MNITLYEVELKMTTQIMSFEMNHMFPGSTQIYLVS